MARNRGFVSLLILGMGLIIVTLGLMFHYFVSRSVRLESGYIRDLNLRKIVGFTMGELLTNPPVSLGEETTTHSLVLGGPEVSVTRKVEFSSDNNFRILSVEARTGESRFGLRNYTFIPTEAVQNRAGSYVFSSEIPPGTSSIKNMDGAAYSTGTHFNVPIFDNQMCAEIDMEEIKRFGFGQYVYYHRGNLNIPKGDYKCNSMLIINGSLTITAGTTFTGRMIFLVCNNAASTSSGSTTIGNNVTMDDGFILSELPLVIGSGCNLTGHFRTNISANIKGSGTFKGRADAGRPFQSVAYVY